MLVADVRKRLKTAVTKSGGGPSFARAVGVSPELVRLVLVGKREPAGKILEALGIERAVIYRRRRP